MVTVIRNLTVFTINFFFLSNKIVYLHSDDLKVWNTIRSVLKKKWFANFENMMDINWRRAVGKVDSTQCYCVLYRYHQFCSVSFFFFFFFTRKSMLFHKVLIKNHFVLLSYYHSSFLFVVVVYFNQETLSDTVMRLSVVETAEEIAHVVHSSFGFEVKFLLGGGGGLPHFKENAPPKLLFRWKPLLKDAHADMYIEALCVLL